MILFPVPHPVRVVQVPGLLVQCLPLLAYYISVFNAPISVNEPSFMTLVVIIRSLLLCPFIFRIPSLQILGSTLISARDIHSGYSASYKMGLLCSLVLFAQQTYLVLKENGLGTVVAAINSNPAVSALGYDSILYVVLCFAWSLFNPDIIDLST